MGETRGCCMKMKSCCPFEHNPRTWQTGHGMVATISIGEIAVAFYQITLVLDIITAICSLRTWCHWADRLTTWFNLLNESKAVCDKQTDYCDVLKQSTSCTAANCCDSTSPALYCVSQPFHVSAVTLNSLHSKTTSTLGHNHHSMKRHEWVDS